MAVFELYSKRKKAREEAGKPQLLKYDELPTELRVQVIHIWREAIGPCEYYGGTETRSWQRWEYMRNVMRRELGRFALAEYAEHPREECERFLLSPDTNVDEALGIIELTFMCVDQVVRKLNPYERSETGITQDPDGAICELNTRFREHAVGYRFEGKIIRADSEYLHSQTVGPAIQLLHAEGFKGAEDEFMEAHQNYRKGDFATAINKANHAFETTIKTICDRMKRGLPKKLNAKDLLDHCFAKGLIPAHMQSHFGALRSTLESGLPTLRNITPGVGHGKGP